MRTPPAIWTEEDLQFLRKYYLRYSDVRIAKEINRTLAQVKYKIYKEGISKQYSHVWKFNGSVRGRYWMDYEVRYLRAHYPFGDLEKISWEINRSVKALHLKAESLLILRGKPHQRNQKRIRTILRYHISLCKTNQFKYCPPSYPMTPDDYVF